MVAEIDISVILPTRDRARQAEEMIRSLVETAARPERIELVAYVDLDDTHSHAIDTQGLSTRRIVGPRTMMGVMTNRCFEASRGRHLLLANDDIVFRTRFWDVAMLDSLSGYSDGVGMAWGNDGFTGGPTHPLLPRALCQRMGHICPNAYDRVFIDVHLHDLFQKLKQLGYDRLSFLPHIDVEHVHPDAGKSEVDETSRKAHLSDDEMVYIHFEDLRREMALRLADYIEQYAIAETADTAQAVDSPLARAA